MRLSEIASLLNCDCSDEIPLTGISIDSRQVLPGNLFIAIQGDRFNGHDFVSDAIAKGAVAIVTRQPLSGVTVPQWVVPDTLKALAAIATFHRQQLDCAIVALTGSNGKTTVKEMIAAILPQPSFATPGNLNNHIGVPLSVLQLQKQHRYAVFELGANHLGEIAHTVAIVQPQITLINNVAPAHIEGFGSIEGVARAKGEIHQGLAADGTAVINEDDAYAHFWDSILAKKHVVRFSIAKPVDIYARDILLNSDGCGQFILVLPQGEVRIELKVPGMHNVSNAVAAAACTNALGIPLSNIEAGLVTFSGVSGRMTVRQGKNSAVVIDDTYNANLRSTLSALEVLATRSGRRIFVFGDMGELGEWSRQHHEEVGVAARRLGIEMLMTCGSHSKFTQDAFGTPGKHFDHQASLVEDLLPQLDAKTTVLVKGSRSSAMEKIVFQLLG